MAAPDKGWFGYPRLRAALATARRMRVRLIEVFLPEVFSTRPPVEALELRARDFLVAITAECRSVSLATTMARYKREGLEAAHSDGCP